MTTSRTSLWDGPVRESLIYTELYLITPSLSFFAVALLVAIIFGVPFVGAINVWPAYAWIYLLIILVLYAVVWWTIHNTSSLGTVYLDTVAMCLVVLMHVYCVVVLTAWLVMQPIGLVPLAAQREFSYTVHVIMAVLHIFRLIYDVRAVGTLLGAAEMVRKRKKAALGARRPRDLQAVNGSDAEEEMDEM